MNITNTQNLPSPIVEGIKKDRELYKASHNGFYYDISLTQLIAPPQIRVLTMKHKDEIVQDASDMLWAFFGSAVHAYLEIASKHGTAEQRLQYSDYETGLILSGMFDLLENGILYDYKLMSVWSAINGVKPEHEAQLNSLCWLARKHDYDVNELKIVSLFRDWSHTKAQFDNSYPQHQILTMPVSMWSEKMQETYITDRLLLHYEAETGKFIPLCTDEERWASPARFAVMKEGNKQATKLFDIREAADEFIENHKWRDMLTVVERPREYKRCEKYCLVANWCEQWQGDK